MTLTEVQQPPRIAGRARTAALICLLAASFMELMDGTVVNVALPTIRHHLNASDAQMQWIVAGYPLAFAVGLILCARLGDRFGRRRTFVTGLASFAVMSLACGLAADAAALTGFRLLQGLAAAIMVPQVLTNIQVMYPPEERGRAMAGFTAVIGVAAVAGPVVGAVLTEADVFGLSWRPVFLVNVPVAIVAIIAARVLVPESRADDPATITPGSAALLGISLGAIVLPITLGPQNDWPVWGFVLGAAGIAGLVAFARLQRRMSRAGIVPLVPPEVFRTRSFARGAAVYLVLSIPTGGFFLVQSMHLQAALGWSVLHTGLAWIPFSLAVPVTAGLAATKLVPAIGYRVLQVGAVVFVAGMVAMAVVEGFAHPAGWYIGAYIVAGAGFGVIVGSAGLLVLNDVPVRYAGAASGIFTTVQALSVALGAAIFGTVYTSIADAHSGYRVAMLAMAAVVAVGGVAARALRQR